MRFVRHITGFLLFVAFLPTDALAFPEMVRHGYVNCTSCHVSPSGGGILTPYGRSISKELLSTWGKEGEEQFVYGLVKPPEWLNLGGDYRHIYLYDNTPSVQEGRPIFMQADLEAAATAGKWTLVATAGYQDPMTAQIFTDHLISRQHYILFRPTDEFSIRGGRFFYAYGINMPDHTIAIRGGLPGSRNGLGINDEDYETYNLEGAWIGEKYNAYITGIFGRPDAPQLKREQGVSANVSASVADTYKFGVSYLYGTNDDEHRTVIGPFGMLGFTPHLFLLSEFDFQGLTPKTGSSPKTQWGMVDYQRLDYEWVQGFHTYFTQELGRLDFSNINSLEKAYSLGLQFFPRPHFEFNLIWQKQSIPSLSSDYLDFAWIMFHYYL